MKILLSFNFLFFLFFFGIPGDLSDEACIPAEEEAAVTTMIKVCDFHPISTGGTPEGCNNTTLLLNINNDCIGVGEATVRVANLVDNPINNQSYTFTDDVGDIYYEYSVLNQTTTIGPINTFTFKGEHVSGGNGQDYPIFEFTSVMIMDLSEPCEAGTVPMMVPFSVRLLDEYGNLYPIMNFAAEDNVFSCQVFFETCNGCIHPPVGCNGGSPPVYNNLMACGVCGTCAKSLDLSGETPEVENNYQIADVPSTRAEISNGLNVQPNPFNDLLSVKYALESREDVLIEIFDSKGELVQFIDAAETQGENVLNVNTSDFLNGLYFCRIKIGSEVFIRKVVKIK